MYVLRCNSPSDSLSNEEDSSVIHLLKLILDIFISKSLIVIDYKTVHMLLQGAYSLHKSTFKIGTDTHNLTCSLHLSSKGSLCGNELIKRKSWYLNYHIVKCRLKACKCSSCNGILNLIKSVAKCNLSRYLSYRIACGLGGKSR